MKCEELLAVLSEYVDGTVDPAICKEFEDHLAGCDPCQVVVDTIRNTIILYKQNDTYELPEAFQQHLHAALRRRWQQTHPKAAQSLPVSDTPEKARLGKRVSPS